MPTPKTPARAALRRTTNTRKGWKDHPDLAAMGFPESRIGGFPQIENISPSSHPTFFIRRFIRRYKAREGFAIGYLPGGRIGSNNKMSQQA